MYMFFIPNKINHQSVVNTDFNKRQVDNFQFLYKGHALDTTKSYTYLGLTITSSGSFSQAIKCNM